MMGQSSYLLLILLLQLSLAFSFVPKLFVSKNIIAWKQYQPVVHHRRINNITPAYCPNNSHGKPIQSALASTSSSSNIQTKQIVLSSGTTAEIMQCQTSSKSTKSKQPPLVFIHGSFHASWCWKEHFFQYFASYGYNSYALSLQGTGGTFAGEGVTKVKVQDHVNDLKAFLEYVSTKEEELDSSSSTKLSSPIVISHSFGGLAIMKYLEDRLLSDPPQQLSLGGIIMLCSVPPSGNGKMTLRYLKNSLKDSWRITRGLAMKKVLTDEALCRTLFFGDDKTITQEDIQRYQSYFERDTVATIDLIDLGRQLPSVHTLPDQNYRVCFADKLPPSLVIGASDDFIVDAEGVQETANYYGVEPTIIESSHDVMLGKNWKNCADTIRVWLSDVI